MFKYLNKNTYIAIATGVVILAGIIILANGSAPVPGTSLPSFLKEDAGGGKLEETTSSYTHPDNLFSFSYPNDFSVRTQDDGEEGETIMIERQGTGVQIFISPFDENIALTPERIREDIPELVMNNTEVISVGGTQATAFVSTNASTETSNEIWFVYTGRLYQASAPKGSEKLMSGIIKSWRWE